MKKNLIIASGGQTGADRAALRAAIDLGLACCGWCPKGRRAEDGRIPDTYPLKETPHADYPERTEWNVRDSDGTAVFSRLPLSRGTKLTVQFCKRLGKPFVVIEPNKSIEAAVCQLRDFVHAHQVRVLNCAGPRATTDAGIYGFTKSVLIAAFADPK